MGVASESPDSARLSVLSRLRRWQALDLAYLLAVPASVILLLIVAGIVILVSRRNTADIARKADVPMPPKAVPTDEGANDGSRGADVVAAPGSVPDLPGAPSGGAALPAEEIVGLFDASVCQVRTSHGSGSGFVVGPKLIATNEHVIGFARPADLRIEFPASENLGFRGAELVYGAESFDLVLLRVDALPPLRAIPVHPSAELKKGERVVIIGSPGGLRNVVTEGVLGSFQQIDGQRHLQLSAAVNSGNSGGPALTLRGRLAGIVTLKSTKQEGIGYAVPGDALIAGLQTVAALGDDERRLKVGQWQAKRLAKELVRSGRRCRRILTHYANLARNTPGGGEQAKAQFVQATEKHKTQLRELNVFREQTRRAIPDLEQRATTAEARQLLSDVAERFNDMVDLAKSPALDSAAAFLAASTRQNEDFDRLCHQLMASFGIDEGALAD
jgi:S1-C subfamily serine protease